MTQIWTGTQIIEFTDGTTESIEITPILAGTIMERNNRFQNQKRNQAHYPTKMIQSSYEIWDSPKNWTPDFL